MGVSAVDNLDDAEGSLDEVDEHPLEALYEKLVNAASRR
jgi:hypothetical protein